MSYPYRKTVNKYGLYVYVCAYLPYTWIQSNVLLDGQPFLHWYQSARNGREETKLKHDENDDLCIKNGLHSSRSWYELRKKKFGG